jgi:plasmid stability protein
MEAEARAILKEALQTEPPNSASTNLYEAIRHIIQPVGGIDIDLPGRGSLRDPPKFE